MTLKCVSCGESNYGCLELHHWEENSDETIPLCPNCHALLHRGILVIDNQSSREALAEINVIERFVGIKEIFSILEKHNYEPYFDGEHYER